jgi:hypothetical protein
MMCTPKTTTAHPKPNFPWHHRQSDLFPGRFDRKIVIGNREHRNGRANKSENVRKSTIAFGRPVLQAVVVQAEEPRTE